MSVGSVYPVRVDATLEQGLSRWLWLVKWLLAIPHYVVLFFLWIAFVVVSFVAFFAILFTGRYPDPMFEFNVGVLRWSWRVAYYSYGALGTDRYPPFTLAEVTDYPAHLEIDHPDHLSRGLVLVKWWLLAIPQYLVVGVFAGGGTWAAWQTDHRAAAWGGGLIGLLVLVAAVALTFTGRYPRQIFDFVLGLNRWVLRVAAYAALMTDEYPPFRLDMGGHESGPTMTLPAPPPPGPAPGEAPAGAPAAVPPDSLQWGAPAGRARAYGPDWSPQGQGPTGTQGQAGRRGWTAGRVVALVAGSVLALASVGLLAAGAAVAWLDNTQRDAAGYLTSDSHVFTTPGYAITSDRIDLGSSDVAAPSEILGTVRFQVTSRNPATPVFVGIAPRASAEAYLSGVSRAVITDWATGTANYGPGNYGPGNYGAGNYGTGTFRAPGGPPPSRPAAARIWVASTSGLGTQNLTWKPTGGDWLVVVMNSSATPGVSVTADAGASMPSLGRLAGGLFAGGALLLIAGTVLIAVPLNRVGR